MTRQERFVSKEIEPPFGKLYLALGTDSERNDKFRQRLIPDLSKFGYQESHINGHPSENFSPETLLASIDKTNTLIADLDGTDTHPDTAISIGYAAAKNKRIVGYRGDFRIAADNEGCAVNLQVEYFIKAHGGIIAKSREELCDFLRQSRADAEQIPQNEMVQLPKHLYLAGPFGFSETGRDIFYEDIAPIVKQEGYFCEDPWTLTDVGNVPNMPYGQEKKDLWTSLNVVIGKNNATAMRRSMGGVVILDEADSGTASEEGYMFGLGNKPMVGYHGEKDVKLTPLQRYCIEKSHGMIINSTADLPHALEQVFNKSK